MEEEGSRENTTLVCVATNAAIEHVGVQRLAVHGHDGLARSIVPAHTLGDGDTVFALTTGEVAVEPHDLTMLGLMAMLTVERAVERSVTLAEGLAGGAVGGGVAGELAAEGVDKRFADGDDRARRRSVRGRRAWETRLRTLKSAWTRRAGTDGEPRPAGIPGFRFYPSRAPPAPGEARFRWRELRCVRC